MNYYFKGINYLSPSRRQKHILFIFSTTFTYERAILWNLISSRDGNLFELVIICYSPPFFTTQFSTDSVFYIFDDFAFHTFKFNFTFGMNFNEWINNVSKFPGGFRAVEAFKKCAYLKKKKKAWIKKCINKSEIEDVKAGLWLLIKRILQ